jgi:hypothetical protein
MDVEVWQIALMRSVLNEFCLQRSLSLEEQRAMDATRKLMGFVRDGIDDRETLLELIISADGSHSLQKKPAALAKVAARS